MVKSTFLVILLALATLSSSAQKEDRVWCFGLNAGVDFNDLNFPLTFNSYSRNASSSACLSDSLGNLVLNISVDYSTFQRALILGSNGQTIANGSNIFFTDFTNSTMFVPIDDSTCYLFCIGVDSATAPYTSLYYNLIQKTQSIYTVTKKNIQLLDIPLEAKISATKQATGKAWWITVHQSQNLYVNSGCNNSYYVFKVNKERITDTSLQIIGVQRCGQQGIYGEMTFSQSGKTLASTIRQKNMVELADFDRCTGLLSNPRQIVDVGDSNVQVYGVEFSPDETKLYVLCGYDENVNFRHSELYQFDLSASNIADSKVLLYSIPITLGRLGELQIAPNGKIYLANYFFQDSVKDRSLGVVNNPDSLGLSCNFDPFGFQLTGVSTYSLPNNPNYNLGPLSTICIRARVGTLLFASAPRACRRASPSAETAWRV